MTLTGVKVNNNYGIFDFCPVSSQPGYSADLSESTYLSLYKEYDYCLATWIGSADDERIFLLLRFEPIKNNSNYYHTSEVKWAMGFRRKLVLINDFNEEVVVTSGDILQTFSRPNGGTPAVGGNRIDRIRFGNTVTGAGSEINKTGMFVQMSDSENNQINATVGFNEAYIDLRDYDTIGFNPVTPTDLGLRRIPIQTSMYIDITVDTIESVNDNPLFQ